ncbi:MAG: hypothetical protein GXO22_02490 [Aquificae bacterium]|nr:hypothetical protein [Aquificota bacterium]
MKKILTTVLAVSTFSMAGDLTLRDVMQKVDFETLKILQGFIWNNDLMVKEGAKAIADHPMPKGGAAKYIPPEKRQEFVKNMKSFERIVHGSAEDIVHLIEEGKREEAFKKYTNMVQGCMSCHSLFRGW